MKIGPMLRSLVRYFAELKTGKVVLWCYLIWWAVTVVNHFDASLALWINSLGISVVIGNGLLLSVARPVGAAHDRWQIVRLFLMPFCVSSFAALIKGRGYLFVFPTDGQQLAQSLAACAVFISVLFVLKRYRAGRDALPAADH